MCTNKRALIFGISGQDGAYLAKLLLEKNYTVFGTSRDASISQFQNLIYLGIKEYINLISSNPCDFRSVLDAIIKSEPEEIYNLAGQSSVGLSFEQPMDTFTSIAHANLTILEVIRFVSKKIRYYNACSSECFGNTSIPATEDTPFKPRSPYAAAKAAAFWQVANYREAYNLFACSGILFNHESPLRPERFVTRKIVRTACRIAQGSNEKLVLGNTSIIRDWGWAPEYVEAMWKMLQQSHADDYIIATGQSYSLMEFVGYVFQALSLDPQKFVRSESSYRRPSDINESRGNPGKAKAILDWQAHTFAPEIARRLVYSELRRTGYDGSNGE